MKTDLRKSLSKIDATAVVDAVNAAARYPSKGVGGSLVPVKTWDGTGEVPAGWTAALIADDKGDGTAVVAVSSQDSARLDACEDQACVDARAKLTAAGDAAAPVDGPQPAPLVGP